MESNTKLIIGIIAVIIVVIILAAVGFLIYWYAIRGTSTPNPSSSPLPTPTGDLVWMSGTYRSGDPITTPADNPYPGYTCTGALYAQFGYSAHDHTTSGSDLESGIRWRSGIIKVYDAAHPPSSTTWPVSFKIPTQTSSALTASSTLVYHLYRRYTTNASATASDLADLPSTQVGTQHSLDVNGSGDLIITENPPPSRPSICT